MPKDFTTRGSGPDRVRVVPVMDMTEALGSIFKFRPVLFAYLFGSRSKGRPRRDSDWDLAVFPSAGLSPETRWNLKLELIDSLGTALKSDAVDLVMLDEASSLLCHRVLRDGELVFCRDPVAKVQFFVTTMQRYFDEQPMRNSMGVILRDRILKGKGAWSTSKQSKHASQS